MSLTLLIVSSPQTVRGGILSLSKSQIKTQISRERAFGLETEQATVTDTLSLKMMLRRVPLRNSFHSPPEAFQPRHAVVRSGLKGQSQVSPQGLPLHGIPMTLNII